MVCFVSGQKLLKFPKPRRMLVDLVVVVAQKKNKLLYMSALVILLTCRRCGKCEPGGLLRAVPKNATPDSVHCLDVLLCRRLRTRALLVLG